MTRIEKKFRDLKANKEKAFIVFLTCGYPNMGVTEELVLRLSKIGVDLIELGVPFSDPLADGPVIQESSMVALRNKVNLNDVLGLVKKIRKKIDTPLCVMTYYNPIFCFPEARFMKTAKAAGVDGIIVPDLAVEEAGNLIRLSKRFDLDIIFFISPTTPAERIKYISRLSRGFIYYLSLTGVTGARERLPADLPENLRRIKQMTDLPVCVGFGLSLPKQIKQIYRYADGVIVGSAVIKKIKDNLGRADLIERIGNFINFLKDV